MSETGGTAAAGSSKAGYGQGFAWISCGWQLFQGQRPLWLGMAGVYLIGSALLLAIPFAGYLLVVLLTPMLLAGALLTLNEPSFLDSTPAPPDRFSAYVRIPARHLFGAFGTSARAYSAVLIGIIVLGLVTIGAIVQYLVGAGSFGSEWAAVQHGAVPVLSWVLHFFIVLALNALLFMAFVFAVPQTVFGGREPISAISESFRACAQHPVPIAVLALALALPYFIIISAFHVAFWLGYLALFTLGLVALPLLVLSGYCGYRELFADASRR